MLFFCHPKKAVILFWADWHEASIESGTMGSVLMALAASNNSSGNDDFVINVYGSNESAYDTSNKATEDVQDENLVIVNHPVLADPGNASASSHSPRFQQESSWGT